MLRKFAIAAAALVTLAAADAAQATTPEGTYRGTYTCSAGTGGVTLTITPRARGKLSAVFSFYPTSKNPAIKRGSFRMNGRFVESNNDVALFGKKWIVQPPGYTVTNIKGKVSEDGRTISGRLSGAAGCTTINVKKKNG